MITPVNAVAKTTQYATILSSTNEIVEESSLISILIELVIESIILIVFWYVIYKCAVWLWKIVNKSVLPNELRKLRGCAKTKETSNNNQLTLEDIQLELSDELLGEKIINPKTAKKTAYKWLGKIKQIIDIFLYAIFEVSIVLFFGVFVFAFIVGGIEGIKIWIITFISLFK